MTDLDDLKKIEKEYSDKWSLHHKFSHKSKEFQEKYPMPDMIEWIKIKLRIKELESD